MVKNRHFSVQNKAYSNAINSKYLKHQKTIQEDTYEDKIKKTDFNNYGSENKRQSIKEEKDHLEPRAYKHRIPLN